MYDFDKGITSRKYCNFKVLILVSTLKSFYDITEAF